jgi:hypothetical protein
MTTEIVPFPSTALRHRHFRYYKELIEGIRDTSPSLAVSYLGATVETVADYPALKSDVIDFTLPILYEEQKLSRVQTYDLLASAIKIIRNTDLPSDEKDAAVDLDLKLLDSDEAKAELPPSMRLKVTGNLYKHCGNLDRRLSVADIAINLLTESGATTALSPTERLLSEWTTVRCIGNDVEQGQTVLGLMVTELQNDPETIPLSVKASAADFLYSQLQPGTIDYRRAGVLRDELVQRNLAAVITASSQMFQLTSGPIL